MRVPIGWALLELSLTLGAVRLAVAQHGVIQVHVAELRSDRPIDSAEVVAFEAHRLARTNAAGTAQLDGLSEGAYRIRVRKPGYVPVEIMLPIAVDTARADVYLQPLATHLDTVRVTASSVPLRLRDFAARRAQGLGRFLDDTLLEREGNRDFAVVAAAHISGVQLRTDVEGRDHLVSSRGGCGASRRTPSLSTLGAGAGGGRAGGSASGDGPPTTFGTCAAAPTCPIVVYLDDMRLGQEDVDLDFVRTWDLAGVEYYTASTVPVRYRVSGAACGVMLLWSR